MSDPSHLISLLEESYPLQRHLGFKLVDWRTDYCRVEMPLATFLMNRYGILHGGVHATLLDTVMGFCGCYTGNTEHRKFSMTLSMTVNFVGQSKGQRLIAEGYRTGGGRRTYFANATVRDDTGADIASGSGVFRYRSSA